MPRHARSRREVRLFSLLTWQFQGETDWLVLHTPHGRREMPLSLLRHLYRSHQLEWESHSRQRSERLEKLQDTRDLPSTPRRRDREALAPRGPTPAARLMSMICSAEQRTPRE